jgi:hypothetical protein
MILFVVMTINPFSVSLAFHANMNTGERVGELEKIKESFFKEIV